jgi:integrase
MPWPAARMKSGIEHRIPLSSAAMAIVERLAATRAGDLVFTGRGRQGALPDDALRTLVPKATVHGFRAGFRNWCADVAHAPREIAEACLAHATGSAVEQAYLRTDVLERRRTILESWGQFCCGGLADKVVQLQSGSRVPSDARVHAYGRPN